MNTMERVAHLRMGLMGNSSLLRCVYTNVDCLTNKLDELKSRLTSLQPDIVAITDSEVFPKHFLNAIPQESLQITGYDLYCSDFSSGRGVCLYCNSSLKATLYYKIKRIFDEALWCCLLLRHKTSLLNGVFYHLQ